MIDRQGLQEADEPVPQEQAQPRQRDWRGYATIAGGVLGGLISAYATIDYVRSLPTGPVVETISQLIARYSIAGLTFLGFYGASAFLPTVQRPREEAALRAPEEIEYRRREEIPAEPGRYTRIAIHERPDGTVSRRTTEITIPDGQPQPQQPMSEQPQETQ